MLFSRCVHLYMHVLLEHRPNIFCAPLYATGLLVVNIAHHQIRGGNRRAVLKDAVHLLTLRSDCGGSRFCLLERGGWVLTSYEENQQLIFNFTVLTMKEKHSPVCIYQNQKRAKTNERLANR